MSAQIVIDQAGLPAGTPGIARTDGLLGGQLVTLTSLSGGLTVKFRLLWVPPGDTTAVASLVSTGPSTWTFSPTALIWGSYRIELIVDEGLPTEERQIRVFGIRSPVQSLLVPAANERADAATTLVNVNAAAIARSENNEPFGPFITGSAWGWWQALSELIAAVEAGGGGGGSAPNPYTIIVGNAANGDTLAVCDLLDPGDCSVVEAALAMVGGPGGGTVFMRPGQWTVAGVVSLPLNVGGSAALIGGGAGMTVITGRQTDRRILRVGGVLRGIGVNVPTATPGAASGLYPVAVVGGSLDCVEVNGNAIDGTDLTDTVAAIVRFQNAGPLSYARNVRILGVSRLNAGNPTPLTGLLVSLGQRLKMSGISVSDIDRGAVVSGLGHTLNGCDITNAVEAGVLLTGASECLIHGATIRADSTTWGNPNWGISVIGASKRNAFSGCSVFQEGVGLAVELASSGASGTGNNAMTGCTLNGSLANLIQVQLAATEAGSTVVGNTVPGGVISDLGVLNEVAHNSTYVIP